MRRRSDLTWRIGTMGFGYAEWRGVFYPPGVKQGDQLSYYASQFDAVELDTTFHAMPTPDRVRHWAGQVDDDFRFTVKTPKQITHEAPPDQRRELMRVFLDTLRPMEHKLGTVLIQFSPAFDLRQWDALMRLLDSIQGDWPLTVEFRHPAWFVDRTRLELASRRITLVANDYFDRAQQIVVTTPSLYLRFIGEHDRYPKMNAEEVDTDDRLAWWADQAEQKALAGSTIWAMFNNDYAGHSPATARRLKRILGMSEASRSLHPARSLFDA